MRRSRHGRDLMRSFSIAGLCLFALVTMPALAGQNAAAPNTLTAAERAEGWQLLFDGHDLSGWRSFGGGAPSPHWVVRDGARSEEHTSELQSLTRISYAVFCLKKKKIKTQNRTQADEHTRRGPTYE